MFCLTCTYGPDYQQHDEGCTVADKLALNQAMDTLASNLREAAALCRAHWLGVDYGVFESTDELDRELYWDERPFEPGNALGWRE